MSPDFIRYLRVLLLLLGIPLMLAWVYLLLPALTSTFLVLDPSPDQAVLTPPFDIVLAHQGCGTIDPKTLRASWVSDWGETRAAELRFDENYRAGQRWILDDYDPKSQFKQGSYGVFKLTVTADATGLCFEKPAEATFQVAESLGAGGIFRSVLHDPDDADEFTVKAPAGPAEAFGHWFKMRVFSVPELSPQGYSLAFRLLGPRGSNLIESKKPQATLWIGLKNGVASKFKVTSADVFPTDGSLVTYKVQLKSKSILDRSEPNDWGSTATPLGKGVSLTNYFMAVVLDADEKGVGLDDWFKIEHTDCTVDCFTVSKHDSRPYRLDFCKEANSPERPDDCYGGFEYGERLCSNTAGAGMEECSGPRYFRVTVDCRDISCFPYGDVSTSEPHYEDRYWLEWHEEC